MYNEHNEKIEVLNILQDSNGYRYLEVLDGKKLKYIWID